MESDSLGHRLYEPFGKNLVYATECQKNGLNDTRWDYFAELAEEDDFVQVVIVDHEEEAVLIDADEHTLRRLSAKFAEAANAIVRNRRKRNQAT